MLEEFLKLLPRLEITEFIGVANLCGAKLKNENDEDVPFEDIIYKMAEKFESLPRYKKRELLSILRAATQSEEKVKLRHSKGRKAAKKAKK